MTRYRRDIYNCVKCDGWVGRDYYCRYCGHQFDDSDTTKMIDESELRKNNAPMHSAYHEVEKCRHCAEPVSVKHKYCKRCGYEFNDRDKLDMTMPHQVPHMGALLFIIVVGGICIFISKLF